MGRYLTPLAVVVVVAAIVIIFTSGESIAARYLVGLQNGRGLTSPLSEKVRQFSPGDLVPLGRGGIGNCIVYWLRGNVSSSRSGPGNGMIALLDRQHISETIENADQEFERDALVSQAIELSVNVLEKRRWVNRGWVLTAISLGALVLMTATYLASIS